MLVIFDWDGTLANTTHKIVSCLQSASQEVGLPLLTVAEYQQIIGLGLSEAIKTLYPDENEAMQSEMQATYSKHFIADKSEVVFFDGVAQRLADLRALGVSLAVATGKSRKGLNRQLAHFNAEAWFDITRCADETASKPNPKMLHEILAETGLHAKNAIMVGDTSFDLDMANNATMAAIGVSYGAHSIDVLNKSQPLAVVDTFEDVYQTIITHFGLVCGKAAI